MGQLEEFLTKVKHEQYARVHWFEDTQHKFYLRAGRVFSYDRGKNAVPGITLANITVYEEFRREGRLARLWSELERIGQKLGYEELQVENVLGLEMMEFCVTRGLMLRRRYLPEENPSFYKTL